MKRRVYKHTFMGKTYDVDVEEPHLGACDHPRAKNTRPQLYVSDDINTLGGLDTLIHESLHACLPDLKHDKVVCVAGDVSKLLWRLGYRRGSR